MSKFVAYCRVSTSNQKDEKTIELQVDALTKYALENHLTIVEWFKDDGVSGALENRPALLQLMKYLKVNSEVEGVLIYKLDRLARDLYVQEGLILEFSKLGKGVVSSLEPDLDGNDPFRKAFRQMLGVFSEFEKAMISLRMKNGRHSAVKKGRWHGGQIYGYGHRAGNLIINEKEAGVVRKIYQLKRYKRKNCSEIARLLNDEKIPTKRGNSKWHSFTVKKILKNTAYRGLIRYKGELHKGNYEPIITK